MMMQMIQIFQIKIIANQSSIFSIICNHLNKTKRKRTKQLSNTQQKNIKLQLFGWSHVDDADDTDDTDRSVTDIGQTDRQTDIGRLTSSIFGWSPTQKALKGKYYFMEILYFFYILQRFAFCTVKLLQKNASLFAKKLQTY